MEARAGFGRNARLAGQGPPNIGYANGFRGGVADRPPPVDRRQIEAVGDRPAPVGSGLDSLEAILDPEQTAQIAGVAVRVPAAGVDDRERLPEVILAVKQPEVDEAVIGDDDCN